ncbi:MAG: malectin domain-containing carbohydrate-binding protein [Microscillaceae bacterium]|nr:malectin domain-containing carbohydrate-binding protein [Microscillaceae bacterium]
MAILEKTTQIIQSSRKKSKVRTNLYLLILMMVIYFSSVFYPFFSFHAFFQIWLINEVSTPIKDHSETIKHFTASPTELIFDTIKYNTTSTKEFEVINRADTVIQITDIVSSSNKFILTSAHNFPIKLAKAQSLKIGVAFVPGAHLGALSGTIHLKSGNFNLLQVDVYGLCANGFEGKHEPSLRDITTTLGYNIQVGWTGLYSESSPALQGDEVALELFQKADSGNVGIIPVARYSPKELLPFGFYTKDEETPIPVQLGVLTNKVDEHQTLFPELAEGNTYFDPKSAVFGIYVKSNKFKRTNYTENMLNSGKLYHRSRIYPLKNRQGERIKNSYLVCFEDASNADYQDYVFVVSNVRPARLARSNQTPTTLININAGGPTYTDTENRCWIADTYFNSGVGLPQSFELSSKSKDVLYLTHRCGKKFSYNIPLKSAKFVTVRLLFLERNFGFPGEMSESSTDRIFNIDIEDGQARDTHFNLNTWVVPGTTFIRTYNNIALHDGILNIHFTAVNGDSMVSAIQVLESDSKK